MILLALVWFFASCFVVEEWVQMLKDNENLPTDKAIYFMTILFPFFGIPAIILTNIELHRKVWF